MAKAAEKRVLVVHSSTSTNPSTGKQHDGFMSGLAAGPKGFHDGKDVNVATLNWYSDTFFFSDELVAFQKTYTAEYIRHYNPQVIYLSDDNALKYLGHTCNQRVSVCLLSVCVCLVCVCLVCLVLRVLSVLSVCVLSVCVLSVCVLSVCVLSVSVLSVCVCLACVCLMCLCLVCMCLVCVCLVCLCA
jgi:hypothetical protein